MPAQPPQILVSDGRSHGGGEGGGTIAGLMHCGVVYEYCIRIGMDGIICQLSRDVIDL